MWEIEEIITRLTHLMKITTKRNTTQIAKIDTQRFKPLIPYKFSSTSALYSSLWTKGGHNSEQTDKTDKTKLNHTVWFDFFIFNWFGIEFFFFNLNWFGFV